MASAQTSIRVGEIKKLSAANKWVSGCSFVDILTDKSAIYCAQAIIDPGTALKIQDGLAAIEQEKDFFPTIDDLREGLDEAEFNRRFGNTKSHAYCELEKEIGLRIQTRKIYH